MIILQALRFILPAYAANMMPILGCKFHLPGSRPIYKKRFGDNKTWRGFYTWYIWALLMLYIQQYAQTHDMRTQLVLLDYANINIFFYAFLFGIWALTWVLIKSYIKRRFGIKPGKPWFPFDQLDFIVWALVFVSPFFGLSLRYILIIIVLTPWLHILTNKISYLIWRKKVPW